MEQRRFARTLNKKYLKQMEILFMALLVATIIIFSFLTWNMYYTDNLQNPEFMKKFDYALSATFTFLFLGAFYNKNEYDYHIKKGDKLISNHPLLKDSELEVLAVEKDSVEIMDLQSKICFKVSFDNLDKEYRLI